MSDCDNVFSHWLQFWGLGTRGNHKTLRTLIHTYMYTVCTLSGLNGLHMEVFKLHDYIF